MLVLGILALITLSLIVFYSVYLGITPMPTAPKVKKALLAHLPDNVDGTIYELGSGWGTLARPLAKKYQRNRITAYELSSIPFLYSKLVNLILPLENLFMQRVDFFVVDLKDAGLVVCYLYPGAMTRLKAKFEEELRQGTWVVSNTFAVPGWQPVKIVEVNDLYRTKVYLYRI